MADNNQPILNLADFAAMNIEDHPELANVLMSFPGSDVFETLSPDVRMRVEALQEIQDHHDELEEKYFEERAALEAKYQNLYQPLYTKRFEIVTGATEVEGVEKVTAAGASEAKGVPSFWLNALKNNDVLVEEIAEQDEDALKFLIDIKWSKVQEPKGFKLEFFFDNNPYFSNSVLTKTYHMVDEDEPILERAVGTKIDWLPGKCLTENIMNKKQKKDSEEVKPITKTETCESFFNFFNPPEVPEDGQDIDDEMAEELQNVMEQDYDVGSTIRDKIIPHAVSWFTGEAAEDFDDDEDDEDELDEDDDDEEDDEEIKKNTGIAQLGDGSGNPPDCKQQ